MSVQYVTTEQMAKFSAARTFTSISESPVNTCNYYIKLLTRSPPASCAAAREGTAVLAECRVH